jgi:hypothetical protein
MGRSVPGPHDECESVTGDNYHCQGLAVRAFRKECACDCGGAPCHREHDHDAAELCREKLPTALREEGCVHKDPTSPEFIWDQFQILSEERTVCIECGCYTEREARCGADGTGAVEGL